MHDRAAATANGPDGGGLRHCRPGRGRAVVAGLSLALGLLSLGTGAVRADEELDYGLETHRLARIEISGNQVYSSDELKNLLRIQESSWTRPLHVPRYQPHLVETQVRLLKAFYRNRGFHQVSAGLDSITTDEGEGDVLHISVQEGLRTYIRRVVFVGNEPLAEARLREVLTLQEGSPAPADLNALGSEIYALLTLYRNETFIEVRVVPEILINPYEEEASHDAEVRYTIVPGRQHSVRQVILSGNHFTRDNIVSREMRIGSGEDLRWDKVEESRRGLLNTSLFRDVTIRTAAIDSLTGETDLVVEVIERKPAFYELGVGVGSLERVRVLAAWGHHNLWGTARRFEVRARGSWNVEDVIDLSPSFDQGQINYRADLRFVNPRLWDSRYSLDWEVYMKRETRGESGLNMFAYGTNLGTSWQASRRVRHSVFLGYKVTEPEVHPLAPLELKNRFAEVDPQADQVRSLGWAVFVDHRDDVFRPTAGMYTVGTAQLAGGALGGDFSFVKWTASWQNYEQVLPGSVLAMRLKLGGTRPYGASLDQGPDGVPYDDRFFAGGSSTVRGYRQNSLGPQVVDSDELDDLNFSSDVLLPDNPARGGNYLMLTNLELRFPLPVLASWKLAGVLFFEGGNVWSQIGDVRLRGFRLHSAPGDPQDPGSTKVWDYRYSWGTGLRLDTPVGPVRVDVGIPLKRVNYVNADRNYQDPKTVWHFSLGYPF